MKLRMFLFSFIITLLAFVKTVQAQELNNVEIYSVGSGGTKEDAMNTAIASGLDQAYRTFINQNSIAKTDCLNSITQLENENILKVKSHSENELPDGSFVCKTVVTLSIDSLILFYKSKGVSIEYSGGMFASKFKLQQLRELSEFESLKNFRDAIKLLENKSFDFVIETTEPVANPSNQNLFDLKYKVSVTPNDNFFEFRDIFLKIISNFSMTLNEVDEYQKAQKYLFKVKIYGDENYYFRNQKSVIVISDIINILNYSTTLFEINDNVQTIKVSDGKIEYVKSKGPYLTIMIATLIERRKIVKTINTNQFILEGGISDCLLNYKYYYETFGIHYEKNLTAGIIGLYEIEKLNNKKLHDAILEDFKFRKKEMDQNWINGTSDSLHYSPSATLKWYNEQLREFDLLWADDSTGAINGEFDNNKIDNSNSFSNKPNSIYIKFPDYKDVLCSYSFSFTYNVDDLSKINSVSVKPTF